MLDPAKLTSADRQGFFIHPDVPDDYRLWEPFFDSINYKVVSVKMSEEAPEMLREHKKRTYHGDWSVGAQWLPTPPEGDGWQWVMKCDSESGPFGLFARPADVSQLATPTVA